ncbi:hypothetical protein QBC34DRAFT_466226 [Podospora aff. communis PSN243]|uniref:Mif2 N-terminal domain-containing protein n=1 Tax=Podospora aff. communis PSN243 TaxID=3040156 RepID=A0AAV9GHW6_9PEZI|nr:hypothetical protein QBC34DRAFT_466226 [Podospora aff. communis PSN243]
MAPSTPTTQDEALFQDIPSKRSVRTYSHRKIGNGGLLPNLRENVPAKKRTEGVFDETATPQPQDAQEAALDKERSEEPDGFEEEYEEYEFVDHPEQENGGTIVETEARSDLYEEYDCYSSAGSSECNDNVDSEEEHDKSHSTPASSLDTVPRGSTRPPLSQPRTLRRRPHLIFDKTPPRGFKKLTPQSKTKKTPASRKEVPGDGFSDGEARPEGLVQVLGKRRLPPSAISGPRALDLTQSAPIVKPKLKPRKKMKRVEDNSFDPAPRVAKRLSERYPEKGASSTARDTPERQRPVLETALNTIESASAPYGAGPSVILRDAPETEQQDGREEETREENEHREKERVRDGSAWEVGRNDKVTLSELTFDSGGDRPTSPLIQRPNQAPVEVSPAETWETHIEESSPFRQRCSSDEVVQVPEAGGGRVPGRRALRRANTT